MKKTIIILLIGVLLLNCVYGFDYVTWQPGDDPPGTAEGDCAEQDIPSLDYITKWESYNDPVFNTPIRRFTDYYNDYGTYLDHEPNIQYSTFTCGNSDNTMVLFKLSDRSAVFYDANTGNLLRYKNFGPPGGGDMELRWSQSQPGLLYYRQNTRFYQYDFDTDTSTLLKNFSVWYPTAVSITNNDKGEQSWGDDRYWAFRVRLPDEPNSNSAHYIVCYDKDTGAKWDIDLYDYYDARNWSGQVPAPRYVTMSPSGKYIIGMFTSGGSKSGGHTALFQRNDDGKLYWVRDLLDWQTGHPAWGYDINGNEVFYRFDSPDFYMYDLETAARYTLFDALNDCPDCDSSEYWYRDNESNSYAPGYHISTSYNIPGWVFYSSYDNHDTLFSPHWMDRVIFAIRASSDSSEVLVWRIANTRTATTSYDNQARTQISQDGKYIYFDSNWLGTRDREIFRAELPSTWYEDLGIGFSVCGDSVCNGTETCGMTDDFPECNSDCGFCIDTVPPIRSNPQPTSDLSSGTDQTMISLTTDESATCRYSTSPGVSYSSMSDTFSTTGEKIHSELITGLSDGNNYNFYVRCSDSSDNHNTDDFKISFRVGSANSSCNSGADKDDSGSVSINEVIDFIGEWISGRISIDQVLVAIGEWKSGC